MSNFYRATRKVETTETACVKSNIFTNTHTHKHTRRLVHGNVHRTVARGVVPLRCSAKSNFVHFTYREITFFNSSIPLANLITTALYVHLINSKLK